MLEDSKFIVHDAIGKTADRNGFLSTPDLMICVLPRGRFLGTNVPGNDYLIVIFHYLSMDGHDVLRTGSVALIAFRVTKFHIFLLAIDSETPKLQRDATRHIN